MRLFAGLRLLARFASSYGGAFTAGLGVTVAGMVFSAQASLYSLYMEASTSILEAQLGAAAVANYAPDAVARPKLVTLKEEVVEEASRDIQVRKKADVEGAGGFGFSADTLAVLLRSDKKLEVEAPKIIPVQEAAVLGRAEPPKPAPLAATPTPTPTPTPAGPTPSIGP